MFTAITRRTGIASHAGVLVTTIVFLSGAAILRGAAAAADPNEDDHFLALLAQEGIPALEGVPSLVDTAHKVCRALNAGIPADRVVEAMVDYADSNDPAERFYAPGRLARTEARFITASVGAYCPNNQSKIAFIVTNPAARWVDPAHRVADGIRNAVNSREGLRKKPMSLGDAVAANRLRAERADFDANGTALTSLIGAVPTGQVDQPNPPQMPVPAPPVAHLQAPPQRQAATPRPQLVPPRPQQPPPPQVIAPQPGAAPGTGGSGTPGGDLPAAPPMPPAPPAPPPPPVSPPAPPEAPGFVRLAP